MKVIIAGSRNFCELPEIDKRKYKKAPEDMYVDQYQYNEDYDLLCDKMIDFQLENGKVTEVVSGTALGADKAGERWAKENSVPIKKFYPNWKAGKSAGIKSQARMAAYADAAILFIRGVDKDTWEKKFRLITKKKLKVEFV